MDITTKAITQREIRNFHHWFLYNNPTNDDILIIDEFFNIVYELSILEIDKFLISYADFTFAKKENDISAFESSKWENPNKSEIKLKNEFIIRYGNKMKTKDGLTTNSNFYIKFTYFLFGEKNEIEIINHNFGDKYSLIEKNNECKLPDCTIKAFDLFVKVKNNYLIKLTDNTSSTIH